MYILGRYSILRVIVAGSRKFKDYPMMPRVLDANFRQINEPITIVCGMAEGADKLGWQYAYDHNLDIDFYPADWNMHGKIAGFIRNSKMAENADMLIAFWDGKSRGTDHMIKTMKKKNLPVKVYKF